MRSVWAEEGADVNCIGPSRTEMDGGANSPMGLISFESIQTINLTAPPAIVNTPGQQVVSAFVLLHRSLTTVTIDANLWIPSRTQQ